MLSIHCNAKGCLDNIINSSSVPFYGFILIYILYEKVYMCQTSCPIVGIFKDYGKILAEPRI